MRCVIISIYTRPLYFFILLVLFLSSAVAQTTPPVPAAFESLAAELHTGMVEFDSFLDSNWNQQPSSVRFGAHLSSANSNLGPVLLSSSQMSSVRLELDGLQAMGARAVTVSISFPLLHPDFYPDRGDYDLYLSFYRNVVEEIRSRGLMLIIESRVIFSQDGFSNLDVQYYYDALTLDDYKQQRMETVRTIAQILAPDYISVITEPDTEAAQTGKPELNTVSVSTDLLNTIITGVRAAGVDASVQIGAGVGSWQTQYMQFIQSFTTTPVDYIDLHIYPVNRDYLNRAVAVADVARAAGKGVGISEAWLYKVADSELATLSENEIFARDSFSFWAPYDAEFLRTVVKLAHYKQVAFLTAFFSEYFRAYIDYDETTGAMNPAQLNDAVKPIQNENILAGTFTSTAIAYADATATQPDTEGPGVPTPVTQPLSTSSIHISWEKTPDNVGTAGYYVYRNGVQIAKTALTDYVDTGLSDGTPYNYAVAAFDLHGNTSPLSSTIPATPPDATAPTTPFDLSANALSASRISLNWSPSTDNVGVMGYRIYMGTSPESMSQQSFVYAPPYSASDLSGETDYYFSVVAYDALGNASAQSEVVSARTPVANPSVPEDLAAVVQSSTEITLSWSSATDDVGVAGYRVLRGLTAESLVQVGYTEETAFVSSGLLPKTGYYFAVIAVDAAGNISAQSSIVVATTDIGAPTTPVGFNATVVSSVQVDLIWEPSTDDFGVAGYRIYRGAAPDALTVAGAATATVYAATNCAPATIYYFAVSAVDNQGNESALSAPVVVTTGEGIPGAAGGLTAQVVSSTQINLAWTAATDDVRLAGYRIFRKTGEAEPALISYVTELTFSNSGLAPNTSYTYTVHALDEQGQQGPGVSVTATTEAGAPTIPKDLAVHVVNSAEVNLTWSASTDDFGLSGYRIYRGLSPTSLTLVAGGAATSYSLEQLPACDRVLFRRVGRGQPGQ